MNNELFGYSVVSALFGMVVVFLFLWVLSVLMSAIKLILKDRPKREVSPPIEVPKGTVATDGDDTDWIVAATAAFLLEEELEAQRSAQAWVPRTDAGGAWAVFPRFEEYGS